MSNLAALARPESRFQTIVPLRFAPVIGAVGAIATVALARVPDVGLGIGCASVACLYGVYVLFAIGWGSGRERFTELTFTLVGASSIGLAIWSSGRWLALGWALHGLWDVLHRGDHHVVGLRGIPGWYIRLCWVWDLLAAIGLLAFMP